MPLPSFAQDTVVRLRAAATVADGYGNQVPDWSVPPAELAITDCTVQPAASNEATDGTTRDTITTRWTWYMPPGSDVKATDRARWQNAVYKVDGDLQHWPSATGELDHIVCTLLKVEG